MVTTRVLTLDELLEELGLAIERLAPHEAFAASVRGAALGGFQAWRAAGLPIRAASDAPLGPHELPGMRPPQ